jgi:hypothetical protein
MEVSIQSHIPPEYASRRPLREYETQQIATGLSRYNVQTKTVSTLRLENGRLLYTEVPYAGTLLSRAYTTELVRMIVYSDSPKVWAEVVSPDCLYFFAQKHLQQDDAT